MALTRFILRQVTNMATREEVLHIAAGQIGYYAPNDPEPGSKYARWLADVTGEDWLRGSSTEIAWCCCFVSWCLAMADQDCTGFPSYNTDLVLGKNPSLVSRSECMPGDIIIWDWDGDGLTDHIGFVNYSDGDYLQTIEGNHGNYVTTVDRSNYWGCVAAIIRPPYSNASSYDNSPNDDTIDYLTTMAERVIEGKYGNGINRIDNLYNAVQDTVNALCANEQPTDSVLAMFANDVIEGKYGNGEDRRYAIYKAVQDVVNAMFV